MCKELIHTKAKIVPRMQTVAVKKSQITTLHSTFPHIHASVIFSLYTSDGVVIKLESGLSLQLIGVSSTEGE